MEEIKIFNSPQFGEIRTTGTSEKPMFCVADVCKALGYANGRDTLAKHVDEEDVAKRDTPTTSGTQLMTYVNESGLYSLIFGSKLPQAKDFKKWVTSEVLPSIRKHGAYVTETTIESIIANPENGIKLLQALQQEREEKMRLQKENSEQQKQIEQKEKTIGKLQPKADFADAAFKSEGRVDIEQAAKILGLPFGRNTLFKKLRKAGVFFAERNEPRQKYIDAGYFSMTQLPPIHRDNHPDLIVMKVICEQKGLAFINHLFGGNPSDGKLAPYNNRYTR